MTKEELKRLEKAYELTKQIEFWKNGLEKYRIDEPTNFDEIIIFEVQKSLERLSLMLLVNDRALIQKPLFLFLENLYEIFETKIQSLEKEFEEL